jgi:hypothetical protein
VRRSPGLLNHWQGRLRVVEGRRLLRRPVIFVPLAQQPLEESDTGTLNGSGLTFYFASMGRALNREE